MLGLTGEIAVDQADDRNREALLGFLLSVDTGGAVVVTLVAVAAGEAERRASVGQAHAFTVNSWLHL